MTSYPRLLPTRLTIAEIGKISELFTAPTFACPAFYTPRISSREYSCPEKQREVEKHELFQHAQLAFEIERLCKARGPELDGALAALLSQC